MPIGTVVDLEVLPTITANSVYTTTAYGFAGPIVVNIDKNLFLQVKEDEREIHPSDLYSSYLGLTFTADNGYDGLSAITTNYKFISEDLSCNIALSDKIWLKGDGKPHYNKEIYATENDKFLNSVLLDIDVASGLQEKNVTATINRNDYYLVHFNESSSAGVAGLSYSIACDDSSCFFGLSQVNAEIGVAYENIGVTITGPNSFTVGSTQTGTGYKFVIGPATSAQIAEGYTEIPLANSNNFIGIVDLVVAMSGATGELQEKLVSATLGRNNPEYSLSIGYDSDYIGLSSVSHSIGVGYENVKHTITENGSFIIGPASSTQIADGYQEISLENSNNFIGIVDLIVDISQAKVETGITYWYEIQAIAADSIKVGINKNGEQTVITPSQPIHKPITFYPSEGYDAFENCKVSFSLATKSFYADITGYTSGDIIGSNTNDLYNYIGVTLTPKTDPYIIGITGYTNESGVEYKAQKGDPIYESAKVIVAPNLETGKTLTINVPKNVSASTYNVSVKNGYDGFSAITVNVNSPEYKYEQIEKYIQQFIGLSNFSETVHPSEGYDAISSVTLNLKVKTVDYPKFTLTANTEGDNYIILDSLLPKTSENESAFLISPMVQVKVPDPELKLQSQKVVPIYLTASEPRKENIKIIADSEYDYMEEVLVSAYIGTEVGEKTLTGNGVYNITPSNKDYVFTKVSVTVDVPEPETKSETLSITANTAFTLTNEEGILYDKVDISVDVSPTKLQDKAVTIEDITQETVLLADDTYDALSSVTLTSNNVGYSIAFKDVDSMTVGEIANAKGGIQKYLYKNTVEEWNAYAINDFFTNHEGMYTDEYAILTGMTQLDNVYTTEENYNAYAELAEAMGFTDHIVVKKTFLNKIEADKKTVTYTENGTYNINPTISTDAVYHAIKGANITVNVPEPETKSETLSITANTAFTLTNEDGILYDKVDITVDLPEKNIEETKYAWLTLVYPGDNRVADVKYTPSDGYDAMGELSLNYSVVIGLEKTVKNITENGIYVAEASSSSVALSKVFTHIDVDGSLGYTLPFKEKGLYAFEPYCAFETYSFTFGTKREEMEQWVSMNFGLSSQEDRDEFITYIGSLNSTPINSYAALSATTVQGLFTYEKWNEFFNEFFVSDVSHSIGVDCNIVTPKIYSDENILTVTGNGVYNVSDTNTEETVFKGYSEVHVNVPTVSTLPSMVSYTTPKVQTGYTGAITEIIDLSNAMGSLNYCLLFECTAVTKATIINVSSSVTSLVEAFSVCRSLTELNGLTTWNTSQITDMTGLFSGTYSLSKVDLTSWDGTSIGGNTTLPGLQYFLYNCPNLVSLIGDHTIEEAEDISITCLQSLGESFVEGSVADFSGSQKLRYSTLLALANGLGQVANCTFNISQVVYDNCFNDDDTTPDADTIAARKATLENLITGKGWTFAKA